MPGNWPVLFGKGPTEKCRAIGNSLAAYFTRRGADGKGPTSGRHLAGGLPYWATIIMQAAERLAADRGSPELRRAGAADAPIGYELTEKGPAAIAAHSAAEPPPLIRVGTFW